MIFSRETLEKMSLAPKGKEMFCNTKRLSTNSKTGKKERMIGL